MDLVGERWPLDVFEVLGVPASILPPVVRAGAALGTVGREAVAATGIPVGTPVVAGMTDGCAAQMSAGALGVGSWNVVLGTTLVFKGVTPNLIKDPGGVVYSHRYGPRRARRPGCGARPAGAVTYPLHAKGERFPFIAPEAEGFTLGTPTDDVATTPRSCKG